PLNAQRHRAVLDVLLAAGAASVIDLGCGQGQFLRLLLEKPRFARIGGADVSASALATAERRLRLDRMGDRQRERLSLFQGSVTYEDDRFAGYDAAVLMEVIEHIDPSRLAALARVVFGVARPGTVVVTTPNVEYNQLYAGLTGARHADHRFEWTRAEFAAWAERVAAAYGYTVEVSGIGDPDEVLGQPTQLGVFRHG
ncbi:MAG TPA: methyltransferase, partial [Nocardioides sp.]|nr:methyltransferase [Nocardioides sp.]